MKPLRTGTRRSAPPEDAAGPGVALGGRPRTIRFPPVWHAWFARQSEPRLAALDELVDAHLERRALRRSVASVVVLGLAANLLAAALLAFTIVFYAVVYSMWLKRATAQNIVIGGAAGALPPVIGQAVVSGSIGIESLILFAIIFIWTPPHFWALALIKADEYARAGIPMMPNVAGPASTRRQIVWYSLLLAPLGLVPVALGFGGLVYAVVGLVGGLGMVAFSIRVLRNPEGDAERRAAMGMFGFSILYLFALFSALLAEQSFGLFRPVLG